MKLRASILAATASLAPSASALTSAPSKPRRGCSKLFTVRMGERAAEAVYRPSRSHVSLRNLRLLGYIERCERNPQAQGFVRAFDRRLGREWKAARQSLTAPWNGPVLASWYDDAGTTGCGFHVTYGLATSIIPCGTRITLQHDGRTVTAERDDSPGPAVAAGGRTFDLNAATKAAIGCSDLCDVRWRQG